MSDSQGNFEEKHIELIDLNIDEKENPNSSYEDLDWKKINEYKYAEAALKKIITIKKAPLNVFTWGDLCY